MYLRSFTLVYFLFSRQHSCMTIFHLCFLYTNHFTQILYTTVYFYPLKARWSIMGWLTAGSRPSTCHSEGGFIEISCDGLGKDSFVFPPSHSSFTSLPSGPLSFLLALFPYIIPQHHLDTRKVAPCKKDITLCDGWKKEKKKQQFIEARKNIGNRIVADGEEWNRWTRNKHQGRKHET